MAFDIAPKIPREEYDHFRLLLKDDLEFPTAADEWFKRAAQELEKSRKKGEVRELVIHHQEFADWCRRSGLNPSLTTLRAYAVAKANGKG